MADGSILHGYPLFQRFTQQVLVSGCCVLIAGSPGEINEGEMCFILS